MKINSISLISLLSTLACVSVANADVMADFYLGGTAGAGGQTIFTDSKSKTDSAGTFGAIAGIDMPIFRFEAEYNYFTSADLDTNAGLINFYAKMPSTVIMPYIGAGIGMVFGGDATASVDGVKKDYSIKTSAAYQAMLGATIDVGTLPIKIDIEGRVLYAPNVYDIDATDIKPDMLQYNLRAKVRYIF